MLKKDNKKIEKELCPDCLCVYVPPQVKAYKELRTDDAAPGSNSSYRITVSPGVKRVGVGGGVETSHRSYGTAVPLDAAAAAAAANTPHALTSTHSHANKHTTAPHPRFPSGASAGGAGAPV